MKVAVICANGKAGKLIVKEAVERGLDVTAVVRGDNATLPLDICAIFSPAQIPGCSLSAEREACM